MARDFPRLRTNPSEGELARLFARRDWRRGVAGLRRNAAAGEYDGRVSELGSRSGLDDFRGSFATPHECTGISLCASASLDRHRFTSKHGLVEENRSVYDLDVRPASPRTKLSCLI